MGEKYLARLQVVTRDILPKGLKFRFRNTEFPFWSIHLPKMLTRVDPQFFWGRRRILLGCSEPFAS
jgi:hypothetical protein